MDKGEQNVKHNEAKNMKYIFIKNKYSVPP